MLGLTRLVLIFLDLIDIREFLLINKKYSKELLDENLYSHICCIKLRYTSPENLNSSNILSHYQILTGKYLETYHELFKAIKDSKNLIVNPTGENDLEGWERINGGNGFEFELTDVFKDKTQVILTSYGWCRIIQEFTISSNENSVLVVGTIACRRIDCGSVVQVNASVNETDLEVTQELPEENPSYKVYGWTLVKLTTEVTGENKVKCTFSGKDTRYWAGTFGARIGYCFAYLFNNN